MMESRAYKDKNVAVFGLGKSGFSTAVRLRDGAARVTVWDDNEGRRASASAAGLDVGDLVGGDWQDADYLVLSPGVPLTHPAPHPVVLKAEENGTGIIGDIEVFLNEKTAGKIVGITGTNGKSTTSSLIHHLLAASGRETALGGNIGTPVMDLPQLAGDGTYVLELSSYQLDLTPSWHGDIAVLLNITPDHLDRHGDMDGYRAVKEKIFARQTASDLAVINVDDPLCAEMALRLKTQGEARVVPLSTTRVLEDGVAVVDGVLVDHSRDGQEWTLDISGIETLRGRHNWQNAAAAVAVVRALGLTDEEIAAGLASFGGLAHRMELIRTLNGVRFVNDSKATNAEAAEKALVSYDNIHWIVGGLPKQGGIDGLADCFPRVTKAYLIGQSSDAFAAALQSRVDFVPCGDLETAVQAAAKDAFKAINEGGEAVVLLSPAAASFDQFASFEARGDAFREIVNQLDGEGA
ncbi:UDP-N-acetylmuramoyl-L-alanine--D-glutamate ligase [Sneathiella chinensis]|uniref:UDP-N-acetylmuramoylalanine--D-glutamate ligase n=1 Tax=Sneathiella chinensis TaxID=349750 RepID=A0ABQ5U1E3_9PROT|nr:UDP-N-acetylmuramoyl-L-alanine--D-glutamate ligase [Sneathiella chinensis]GLQ06002.1 UDP-N-acetylmuramoylalanine--D-glutamate ligase [Sneathiella chinensis]